ncbi:MAG: hypothetical protein JXM71_09465, partial [Spirochaetales bacterium]|nr:hypothetical protein [Spirochaetales bacterium]
MAQHNASQNNLFPVGSRVIAQIHPIERERGVFIPGHRFEPLRKLSLDPWQVRLEAQDASAFTRRKIGLTIHDAEFFYLLLGRSAFFKSLLGQDPSNDKVFDQISDGVSGFSALVRIEAYDFAEFYERNSLVAGDYLLLEAIKPQGVAFRVTPVPASSITESRHSAHLAALDRAVDEALDSLEEPLEPSLMIREIFRLCDPAVLEEPAAAFSEYVRATQKLGIGML